MKICRALLGYLLVSFCMIYAEGGLATSAPKNDALDRIKALPPPLQSSTGTIFVSCATGDRAALRWPVMQFAEAVSSNLSDAYLPLGSATSPLAIELGSQTNVVADIKRSVFRTGDGFSQLIIRVPNPETVDLEIFREAVAEALLRERVREETGRYADFSWPKWFLRAIVNASKGNLWKVEAYERLQASLTSTPPTLEQILLKRECASTEVDAFFAIWLLEETRYAKKDERLALLHSSWSAEDFFKTLNESDWQKWLTAQEGRIFLPGTLTRSQFLRWHETMRDPIDAADAVTQANNLGRVMIGRPQLFRDVCDLYLKAYAAYISGGDTAYQPLRAQANEAADILKQYFMRNEILAEGQIAPTSSSLTDPAGASRTL